MNSKHDLSQKAVIYPLSIRLKQIVILKGEVYMFNDLGPLLCKMAPGFWPFAGTRGHWSI